MEISCVDHQDYYCKTIVAGRPEVGSVWGSLIVGVLPLISTGTAFLFQRTGEADSRAREEN